MLQEPTSAPHSWERKVGTLCLGQAAEDLVSFEETRKKGGRGQFLACFSLPSEDLTEALLEFTAADLPGDAASISPFLATSGSEDTGHAKLV